MRRVEPPAGGRLRTLAPFLGDERSPERSLQHLYHDAGKRSVVVDRDTVDGRRAWEQLVRNADAVVETERLDHGALRRLNGRIVHVTITPFGLDGPWSTWKGNDLVASAASGLAWVCGRPGDPPNQPGADQAYKMGGLAAAYGTMAALHGLSASAGAGAVHLDISLQVAAAMATIQTSHPHLWLWRQTIPMRPGLTAVHQCRDGQWVTLMVRPDRLDVFLEWCREAGVEVPTETQGLLDPNGATRAVTLLVRELASHYTRPEFFARAWADDLIGLPVNTLSDLEKCEHLIETGAFVDVDHAGLHTALPFPRSPFADMAPPLRRAPRLGEHSAEPRVRPHASPRPVDHPLDMARALEGIRVVDFCWVLAGPLGTRLLANFGAEVIRVESGERAYDDSFPSGARDPSLGAFHNTVNTHKRSVTIDPRTPRGRELLLELIATADVVTNNYRPGAFEAMGFGYDVLRACNPRVISVHMPGCGRSGPWRDRGAFGNMTAAASGVSYLTGFPGRAPRGLGVALPDFTGPYLLAMTVLAALRRRARRGGGEELEVNQLTGAIALLGVEWLQYVSTGTPPPMRANRDPNWCPHGVYPCAGDDEWIAIAVAGDAGFADLCRTMGQPTLAGDSRFVTHDARKSNEDALDAVLAAWTRSFDRWQLASRLQAAGVAAAAVTHLADAVERDPYLSRWVERVRQPSHPEREIPIVGEAIQVAGNHRSLQPAPRIGQDDAYVLQDLLGLPVSEVARLRAAGVVGRC